MIELLLGPYRTGKTGTLLRRLVQFKQQNPLDRCIILVPSQRYGALLKAQLSQILQGEAGMPGIFGVDIATIYDACAEVLRAARKYQTVLSRDICAAVVAQSIEELEARGELTALAPISKFAGTSDAILRLLDEFERAALPPSHVQASAALTAASASKYRELAAIYRQYWNNLDRLQCHDQKRVAFACREVLADGEAKNFTLGMLLVDGFDRISPLQADVIHALCARARETHIAFDYVESHLRDDATGGDDYSWKDSSFEELKKRFDIAPTYTKLPEESKNPQELAFTALDPQFEMIEIARRCKEAIIHRSIKPEQILVVARNIDQYELIARAAFEDAGLPFAIDHSIKCKNLPLFKLLIQLAELAHNDFPRRAVCSTLHNPQINLSALKLTEQQVDSLDSKSIDKGLLGGRAGWEKFLLKNTASSVAEAVEQFFDIVTPPSRANVSEYCRFLEDIESKLVRHTIEPPMEELEALQGFRSVIRILIQQEQVLPTTSAPISYGEFLARLTSAADATNIRRVANSAHTITICAAEHAPNRRYDEVFIAGVCEGSFPRQNGDTGFISADERARWASYGVIITNPREENGFERALFKSLIERARQRITFSLPEFTTGGDETIPSFFLHDGTAHPELHEHIRPATEALKHPVSAREAVSGWLWLKPGMEIPGTINNHSQVNEFWQTIDVSVLTAALRHQKNTANIYNGYMVDLTESQWLNIKLPAAWSASALNNYGQCPFKFWVSNILKLQAPREPEAGLQVDIKGDLYHKALELYYGKLSQIPPAERTEQKDALLRQCLAEAIEGAANDPRFTPGPYFDNEQKDMLFRLQRFVNFDEARLEKDNNLSQPALFEARFGSEHYEQSYAGLRVDTDCGTVTVRGRIDRIDFGEDEQGQPTATVIDYKTSSASITQAEAEAGVSLQLPLYALAVQRSIMPRVKQITGQYLSINAARSIGSIDFASEKTRGLLDSTIQLIKRTVSSVKSGDFTVRPQSPKACKYCDHKPICRVTDLNHARVEED